MQRSIRFLVAFVLMAVPLFAAETKPARCEPFTFTADDGTKADAERCELAVPESHADPKSRLITLRFVRFKSTAEKPGSPIVYLAGGPGGSGIGAAASGRFPLFLALRAFGDVIALDQRGTGRSEPGLDCDGIYIIDPAAPLTRASTAKSIGEPLVRCAAALRRKGIEPNAYNTRESAHDLDDLRAALGAPKLTLWAISYGTHLALATLKEHGEHVDRVILAGVEPLDATEKLPADQQALLEEIQRLSKRGDLLAAIAKLERTLDEKPAVVTLVHPVANQKFTLTLGRGDLQFVIAQMLTGPETFGFLPDFIARLEEGDWTALALASARFRTGKTPSMMSTAMDCASGASAARRKTIAQQAATTLLGDAINLPYPDACSGLGVADLGDDYRAPVRSDVPALLISGTLDGRTPPRNAEEVMKGLPNSVHLVIDNAGHSDPLFLSSPKILEAMQQFLRGERVTITRAAAPEARFQPARHVVALSDEALAKFVGEYRIDEKSVRKIVKFGSVLYSIRDNGRPNPIRPMSANEFFFEGAPVTIRFAADAEGNVTALDFIPADGKAAHSPRIR